ncbi:hypothetical protein EGW08_015013 [Elysia chlorotica]|uniref:Uncharacterized protein n=1 Tax=Elysia chlorotica TaxID=188477 RepID=A0A433T6K0_ELYCH|nr:hypothetical protein EGW08_015013 [Elysia chlorotica]
MACWCLALNSHHACEFPVMHQCFLSSRSPEHNLDRALISGAALVGSSNTGVGGTPGKEGGVWWGGGGIVELKVEVGSGGSETSDRARMFKNVSPNRYVRSSKTTIGQNIFDHLRPLLVGSVSALSDRVRYDFGLSNQSRHCLPHPHPKLPVLPGGELREGIITEALTLIEDDNSSLISVTLGQREFVTPSRGLKPGDLGAGPAARVSQGGQAISRLGSCPA